MTHHEVIGRSKVYTDEEMRHHMEHYTRDQLVGSIIALVRNNEKMLALLAERWTISPAGEVVS